MSTPALNPLVTKIRAAYPGSYDDMDDATLTKQVLAKYPQYEDLAAPPLQNPVKVEEMDTPMSVLAGMRTPNLEAGMQAPVSSFGQQAKGAAVGAAADVAAMGAAAAGPIVTGAAKVAAKHPIITNMALMGAINQARRIPYLGNLIPPGAEWLPWMRGKLAEQGETVEPETAAPQAEAAPAEAAPTEAAPSKLAPTYRDATLNKRNIPEYAGEDADSVVDQAVPPGGENHGTNLLTKAKVDFALKRGDVAGAESAMDQAASQANPKYQPPANRPPVAELPTFHDPNLPSHPFANPEPRVVPAVQNIRENNAMVAGAEAQPGPARADLAEDQAIQQEMNWNLQQHGYRAESEARREFIARNSTGITKGQLTQQAPDLVQQLKDSLAAVQAKKAQISTPTKQ